MSFSCVGQLAQHVDISISAPVLASDFFGILPNGCLGIGIQGNTVYTLDQEGVCSPGLSIGVAGREYEDRSCTAVVGGVTSHYGVGGYASTGLAGGPDPSDWEVGVSFGEPGFSLMRQATHDNKFCDDP